jgi:hypothetical protein
MYLPETEISLLCAIDITGISHRKMHFEITQRLIQQAAQSVTYVPSTCFDINKVIIRAVYTKTYKYSKLCPKYACVSAVLSTQ